MSPETRVYETTYGPDGIVVEQKTRVVSDAQLLLESLAKEANEGHTQVLQAINNWGALTLAQKDSLLKFLAKFYVVAGERLGLFALGD